MPSTSSLILGFDPVQGQKLMANSFPVVISSDQSTIPVSLDYDSTSPFPVEIFASIPLQVRNLLNDNFNVNSNLQVADIDVSNLNRVPVDIDSSSIFQVDIISSIPLEVRNLDYDAFNVNGNLQVNYENCDTTNPVFVDIVQSIELPVTLATALDSAIDSIDVDLMTKGGITVAHNAITASATSNEIDFRGHNSCHVEVEMTGNGTWDFEIIGSAISGGNFTDQFNGSTQLIRQNITESVGFILPFAANFMRVIATEIIDGATVTIRITPLNSGADSNNLQVNYENCDTTNPVFIDIVEAIDLTVTQLTHDNLNCNSNLQINDIDVDSTNNPVPVEIVGTLGNLPVVNLDHDNFNVNSNIQIDNQDVDMTNNVPVTIIGTYLRSTEIGTEQTITFENSDPQDTQVENTIEKPNNPVTEYELIVYNPSDVSDLTVKIFNCCELIGDSTACDTLVTTVTIPKNQTISGTEISIYSNFIHGIFNGTDVKLIFSNNTVLGAGDGFDAYFKLKEVE